MAFAIASPENDKIYDDPKYIQWKAKIYFSENGKNGIRDIEIRKCS